MEFDHTAGYGFVPLSDFVFEPGWAYAASTDIPFVEGLSGRLEIELTADSPLFVRGTGDKALPFKLPDGDYGLPGSSVRGMVRNLLEIATFGYISRVNDHRYGVRDLRNRELYSDHMARILTNWKGEKEPMPLVGAGWLVRRDGGEADDFWARGKAPDDAVVAQIIPCHFAKLEYRWLEQLAGDRGVRNFNPGERQSSADKYRKWGGAPLGVRVGANPIRTESQIRELGEPYLTAYRQRMLGDLAKVSSFDGSLNGTVVFTGQPSPYRPQAGPKRKGSGNAKHHDFVFWDLKGATPLPVTRGAFQDFEFVHSDRGEQNSLGRSEQANKEWGYWRRFFDGAPDPHDRPGVPVFYLLEPDSDQPKLRAFGLAMMFRLAYRKSVHDGVKNARMQARAFDPISATPSSDRAPDFTETLFGYASDKKGAQETQALRGRVSFGTFRAIPGTTRLGERKRVVLSGPKASYYPNYVEQQLERGPGAPPPGGRYKTFMDEDVRIRGWKRYRVTDQAIDPPPPKTAEGRPLDLERVGTTFQPLQKGASFTGVLRLHNVLPVELGALLWALDFGGDETCRHKLGLARGLGYGQVRVTLRSADLHNIDGDAHPGLDCARVAFEKCMEVVCVRGGVPGGWADSPQITELRALARPIPARLARSLSINNGNPDRRRANEFELAKAERSSLPSATDWRAHERRIGASVAMLASGTTARGVSSPVATSRTNLAPTPTQAVLPPEPEGPNFGRLLFNLQPGTAADILPDLCKKFGGTEHASVLRAAIKGHRIYAWLGKKIEQQKRWTLPVAELLGGDD